VAFPGGTSHQIDGADRRRRLSWLAEASLKITMRTSTKSAGQVQLMLAERSFRRRKVTPLTVTAAKTRFGLPRIRIGRTCLQPSSRANETLGRRGNGRSAILVFGRLAWTLSGSLARCFGGALTIIDGFRFTMQALGALDDDLIALRKQATWQDRIRGESLPASIDGVWRDDKPT